MKSNSIPYLNGYHNIRLQESVTTQRENALGIVAREHKTTITVAEINKADVSNMSKVKNTLMGILLKKMNPSIEKDVLSYFLSKRDKRNIVLDTTNYNKACSTYLAENYNTTPRSVNRALKSLVEDDIIRKLNKYQIMMNPFYITHNHMSLGKIEELQAWWKAKPNKPVEWLDDLNVDDIAVKDLTKIEQTIKQRQEDAKDVAKVKKQNDINDIKNINIAIDSLAEMVKYHKKDPNDLELGHIRNYIAKKHPELALTSLEPIKALLLLWNSMDIDITAWLNDN